MPLIFALILLILISAAGRLPRSSIRISCVLPLGMAVGLIAIWFAISSWSFSPEDAMWTALLILAAGAAAALLAWGRDRLDSRRGRRLMHRRLVELSAAGYRVTRRGCAWSCRVGSEGRRRRWSLV